FLRVGYAHGIGSGFGRLESAWNGERNVLTAVANDIVLERWPTLVDDTVQPLCSLHRAKDLANVLAVTNRAHPGHLFRRRCVEFLHSAVSDRRFDRNGIKHPGKMEIRGVYRCTTHFQRAIYARRLATNR